LLAGITTIIFDLDGTLYVSNDLACAIRLCASRYIASLKGIDGSDAFQLIKDTQKKISAVSGQETTLSMAIIELGGDVKQLHRLFAEEIKPELFLTKDSCLVKLLNQLEHQFELCIYTNNNRTLSEKIMKSLGISGLFQQVFTIEEFWRPKPDASALETIFARIGREPSECLFVGDRYDIDLRLPAKMGSAVFLSKNVQELMVLLKTMYEENI
jgi:putative hydrolase of the HAD superfamily